MDMKKGILTLLISYFAIVLSAQPKLEFESHYYDFGEIKEADGKVTGKFIFTNIGDSNLIITNVRPGCGCTAANFTKTPVAPNEQGFIEATYDPYNRAPGPFTKNIRVYTNEPQFKNTQNPPYFIYIKGSAIQRPPTIFELAGYTIGHGMMRMKSNSCKFMLKNTETFTETIRFKNFDTTNIEILEIKMPPYIVELSRNFNKIIAPEQEVYIVMKYDASQRHAWGRVSDPVTFKTSDELESNKVFIFNADIREDFSYLNNNSKLPALQLSNNDIHFDPIKKGEKFETEITIKNIGEGDLIIRNISTNLNSIQYKLEKDVVKPNKSVKLTITFSSDYRTGKQSGYIEIICNDPANSVTPIRLVGEVLP